MFPVMRPARFRAGASFFRIDITYLRIQVPLSRDVIGDDHHFNRYIGMLAFPAP